MGQGTRSGVFQAPAKRFSGLPLIAEDLGLITAEVDALRERFDLPGMRVLQFGFATGDSEEKYLPTGSSHIA